MIKKGFFKAVAVGTTVWTLTKNIQKRLHENYTKRATCCSKQILEEPPHKTVVRPLTSHLINHSSKTKKLGTAGRSKDEFICDIFLRTPTHGRASVGGSPKT